MDDKGVFLAQAYLDGLEYLFDWLINIIEVNSLLGSVNNDLHVGYVFADFFFAFALILSFVVP